MPLVKESPFAQVTAVIAPHLAVQPMTQSAWIQGNVLVESAGLSARLKKISSHVPAMKLNNPVKCAAGTTMESAVRT